MELICTKPYGTRRVNNREALALIYTFAKAAGKFLIDTIRIEYHPNPPPLPDRWLIGSKRGFVGIGEDTTILMRSDYNPENLRWLGTFIHEATHIWQAHTWHHLGVGLKFDWEFWKQSYDYDEKKLTSLDLGLEQFPEAVEDWFYLNYGIESCLIGKTNQVNRSWVWKKFTDVFKGEKYRQRSGRDLEYLQNKVNPKYEPLLKKIRNPDPPRGKPLIGPDADFSIPPATTTGFRRVNQREAMALVYTFGGEVGGFLIGTIEIGEGSGDIVSKTQMLLPPTHNSEDLFWLGVFIRKAARIWQQRTRRYGSGKRGENYNFTQLQSLTLTGDQHSKAVLDWFYINYGMDYCRIGSGANQLTWPWVRDPVFRGMGVNLNSNLGRVDVLRRVKRHYAHLIEEIRDPQPILHKPIPVWDLPIPLLVPGG